MSTLLSGLDGENTRRIWQIFYKREFLARRVHSVRRRKYIHVELEKFSSPNEFPLLYEISGVKMLIILLRIIFWRHRLQRRHTIFTSIRGVSSLSNYLPKKHKVTGDKPAHTHTPTQYLHRLQKVHLATTLRLGFLQNFSNRSFVTTTCS